jgi:hypothetical protein
MLHVFLTRVTYVKSVVTSVLAQAMLSHDIFCCTGCAEDIFVKIIIIDLAINSKIDLMTTKQIFTSLAAGVLMLPLFLGIQVQAATPNWDTDGAYIVDFEYQGSDYAHDMTLVQDSNGNLTGDGGNPAGGAHVYTWEIASGTVSGDDIHFTAYYTASADAVVPLTVMHVQGTIDTDGSMSGTWTDNYQGGSRSGAWETTSGAAVEIEDEATLVAEDFGVVDYNTGLGQLRGYSAGFGLTDATFENAQSVVVKLYAGDTLLQTNTATAKLGDEITGTQISSPFDVSGNFDYAADGFWDNDREAEYGQSVPATKVVATVTLEDGQIVTATNTNLAGDPTTIYPEEPTPTTPTNKMQCMNGGWMSFTDPSFKNQGQCIKFVNKG